MADLNDRYENLDELLHNWAQRHEPSPDRLSRLRERFTVAASMSPAMVETNRRPAKAVWRQPVPLISLLVALSILVALLVWPRSKNVQAPRPTATNLGEIPQTHLQALTAEMDNLFDHRLAWVAETNRDVSLGLEDSPSHATSGQYIAVRVVVMHRGTHEPQWQPVWTSDVVSRSEELIQVSSASDGAKLRLWTHLLPDGAMSVDTELVLGGPGSTPWISTSIQQPEVPSKMLSIRQGQDEFEVWQTATVLGRESL